MTQQAILILVLLAGCSKQKAEREPGTVLNSRVLNQEPQPISQDATKEAEPTNPGELDAEDQVSDSVHEALTDGLSDAQKRDLINVLSNELGGSHDLDRSAQIGVLLDLRRKQNNARFVAFETEIKEMIIGSCATLGCHDAQAVERSQVPPSSDFTVYPSSRLWAAKMETVAAFANLDPVDQMAISNWINTGLAEEIFDDEVKPILDTNCIVCHSADIPVITNKPFMTYEDVQPYVSKMPSFPAFTSLFTGEQQLTFLDWVLAGALKNPTTKGEVNGEFFSIDSSMNIYTNVTGVAFVNTNNAGTDSLEDDLTEVSLVLSGILGFSKLLARVYTASCAEKGGDPYSFGLDNEQNPDFFSDIIDIQNDTVVIQRKARLAELSLVRSIIVYELNPDLSETAVLCADLQ